MKKKHQKEIKYRYNWSKHTFCSCDSSLRWNNERTQTIQTDSWNETKVNGIIEYKSIHENMHRCRHCWCYVWFGRHFQIAFARTRHVYFRRELCRRQSARSSFDEQQMYVTVFLGRKIGQNANGILKFLKQLLIVQRALSSVILHCLRIYSSQATVLTNRTKHSFVCCDFEQIRLIYCETFRFSFTKILNSSFYMWMRKRMQFILENISE